MHIDGEKVTRVNFIKTRGVDGEEFKGVIGNG